MTKHYSVPVDTIPYGNRRMIRKYQDGDLLRFQEFWNEQGSGRSAHRKAKSFQWLVGHNPFSSTHDDYLVLEEGDGIIAYEGMMPFKFSISGQTVQGCIYHDTMVSPERRGRGLGTDLVRSVMEQHPEFSIAVWMNAPNSKVFKKCGWKHVDGLYTYAKIYTVNNLIRIRYKWLNNIAIKGCNRLISMVYSGEKIVRYLWATLSMSGGISRLSSTRKPRSGLALHFMSPGFRGNEGTLPRVSGFNTRTREHAVRYVDSFDERIDTLFHSVRARFPFIAFRTSKVLNWKYAHDSSSMFKKLISLQGDGLTGYMVFRTREAENGRKIATLFDFLCSPESPDAFEGLLERAMADIERSKPDTVEILCSSLPFIKILKRRGFLRARDNPHALKYFHPGVYDESNGMSRGENWFFTFGDGDKVFWDF